MNSYKTNERDWQRSEIATATGQAGSKLEVPRIGRLDGARVLCAFAVIWIHTPETVRLGETTVLCRFAVPFFAATLGYFAARPSRNDPRAYATRRVRDLYGRFFVWSLIYFLVRWAGARVLGRSVPTLPSVSDLMTSGTVHHLWFLPFAVLVSLLAVATRETRRPRLAGIVLVGCGIGVSCLPVPTELPASYFWGLARANALAGAAGVAMGLNVPDGKNLERLSRRVLAWSLGSFVLLSVAQWVCGRNSIVENVLGVTVFLIAAAPAEGTEASGRVLHRLARAALGVYLVHILWVEGLQDVAHGIGRWDPSPWLDLMVFAASGIASFASFEMVSRTRFAWLVRG